MKKKSRRRKATVTSLTELRELDAFIAAHGGLAPYRGAMRCSPGEIPPGSPESTEAPSSASTGKLVRRRSRLFR